MELRLVGMSILERRLRKEYRPLRAGPSLLAYRITDRKCKIYTLVPQ